MAILKLGIVTGRPVEQLEKLQIPGGKQAIGQKVLNYIQSLIVGGELAEGEGEPPAMQIVVVNNEVNASGTFTLTSAIATDAVSINGVTFTCVASGATGDQFNVGATDADTAENMAQAINNSVTALVADYVNAQFANNVVTISAEEGGLAGNAFTIASADATIVASGARLTGGAPDPGELTLTF